MEKVIESIELGLFVGREFYWRLIVAKNKSPC